MADTSSNVPCSRAMHDVVMHVKIDMPRWYGLRVAAAARLAHYAARLAGIGFEVTIRERGRGDGPVVGMLRSAHAKLDRIERLGGQMATKADFDALRNDLNDSTNAIAARLDSLATQVQQGGMSSVDENAVLAELQAASAALKALGADPDNPVPTPTPVPPPDQPIV